jgi:hypothetical protein
VAALAESQVQPKQKRIAIERGKDGRVIGANVIGG